ncbi:DNA primase small subunit [Tritrichomonas foetus]|uniref:DNA primase n=1 Tax=Tritrichomonas foetus TaxID=1144522 RepID=A0A1J4K900_9EUKA|nr:DNA primase small subunit [Tritrichomonas foetus]|eukprot:OHT07360.1 DNA primase small subunit [Tritrichomonas foetus]
MSNLSEGDLRSYYTKFFPFNSIREWISYGGKEPLDQRECAFWFDEERFNRWSHINDMERILSSVTQSPPERMEIGPVYTHRLKERSSVPAGTFFAMHRELVFDIDSDDFKDIKCCCEASSICEHCWHYMHCALDCLFMALKENFGFKYILPVFSGRRGVHIWVCDEKARELQQPVREGIVKFLNLNETVRSPKFAISNCPFAEQMLKPCEKYFVKIAEEQSIFTHEEISKKVREAVGDVCFNWIKEKLRDYHGQPFENQWASIKDEKYQSSKKKFCEMPNYYRLIFSFTFPRLDANVTITMNHLLKSPFSFHPKSGLISLPIPESKFDEFPPNWVPKLEDLLAGDSDAEEVYRNAVKQFDEFRKRLENE